jgi:hypothetical protein
MIFRHGDRRSNGVFTPGVEADLRVESLLDPKVAETFGLPR